MDPFTVGYSILAVLAAAYVRGYSGFGFALITTLTLTQVMPPAQIVPVVFVLELAASGALLPRVWSKVHWGSLLWLAVGVCVGSPVGVYLLANIPAKSMRAAIAILAMGFCLLLLRGFALRRMPNRGQTMATGLVSGLLNGGAAVGGPPVILFYFSSPAGASVSRASIIAYFLGTDSLALGLCLAQGLVNTGTGLLSAILLAPLLIGIWFGNRSFSRSDDRSFRRRVLMLLLLFSIAALVRAIGW